MKLPQAPPTAAYDGSSSGRYQKHRLPAVNFHCCGWLSAGHGAPRTGGQGTSRVWATGLGALARPCEYYQATPLVTKSVCSMARCIHCSMSP